MIKGAASIVSELYKHPDYFDIKALELSLNRILAGAYTKYSKIGFLKFAEKLSEPKFIEAIIDTLPVSKLASELKKADDSWLSKQDRSDEQMRKRLLALSIGEAKPELNLKAQAKELLPDLRALKTLDAAKAFYEQKQVASFLPIALELLPEKGLRAFVRRFDKFHEDLDLLPVKALIAHVCDLIGGQATPRPKPVKPLKSAAMKAKWSGKEPD